MKDFEMKVVKTDAASSDDKRILTQWRKSLSKQKKDPAFALTGKAASRERVDWGKLELILGLK